MTAAAGGYDGQGNVLPGAWAVGNEQAETVDMLSYMFTGNYPTYRAPTIPSLLGIQVNGQDGSQNINLLAGGVYSAFIGATDPANSTLGYQWMLLPIPSGGPTDHTTYVPLGVGGVSPILTYDSAGHCTFQAPSVYGQYRLSVWVYNTNSKFAVHNAPFTVSGTPSAYTYGVTTDSYIQGPQSTGSTSTNYASAAHVFGSNTLLLGNSYANTKNISYFPYLYFDLSTSAYPPTPTNLPKQVLLNVFSVSGQMSYYNLSVYPVEQPNGWDAAGGSTLSFSSLQTLAPSVYTYNAQYNWPYTPGYGGATNCSLLTSLPAAITGSTGACQPLVRAHAFVLLRWHTH
jgi:hypothetical protein